MIQMVLSVTEYPPGTNYYYDAFMILPYTTKVSVTNSPIFTNGVDNWLEVMLY